MCAIDRGFLSFFIVLSFLFQRWGWGSGSGISNAFLDTRRYVQFSLVLDRQTDSRVLLWCLPPAMDGW